MKEVNIISKVVGRETSGKTATYIPGAGAPSVNLDDYLMKKLWDSVFEIRTDGEGNPYLYEKMPFVTQYGITMYAEGGDLDIPSIYDGLPIDGSTIFWQDGVLKAKAGTEGGITSITSDMIAEALGYTPADAKDIPSLDGYATETYVTERISDLINGAPEAYDTLKEIADVLAGNVNSIGDIITALGTKADKATTLAGYGITDAYTKTKVDELLDNYVTLATAQTITGEKNFTGGLKVNGSPIVYDATKKCWKLEGDLLVTGGVTQYGSDSEFTPSTIMDGVVVDNVTIKKNEDGALYFAGTVDGGVASSVAWENVTEKPTFATVATSGKYSDLSGKPTLLSSFTNDVGFINSSALSGYLLASNYTAADVLAKLKTVDGKGSGLDADMLDGNDIDSVCKKVLRFRRVQDITATNTFDLNNLMEGIAYNYHTVGAMVNAPGGFSYGQVLALSSSNSNLIVGQLAWDVKHNDTEDTTRTLWWRTIQSDTKNTTAKWHQIAFTDSNVASATKLETARRLWGRSFDGTGNVSGNLTDVGNVVPIAHNAYDFGTSDKSWANVYSKILHGMLQAKCIRGTWINGKNKPENAALYIQTQNGIDSYSPILYVKSVNGHVFNLGGIGDYVGFYGFRSSTTDNIIDWRTVWNVSSGNISHSANLSVGGTLVVTGASTLGGDITLQSPTQSAASPKIIFQRGTVDDNYYDSYAYNTGGSLTFGISYGGTNYDRIRVALNDLRPVNNNSYALGTTELRYSNMYSVLGNFSSDVIIGGILNVAGDTTLSNKLTLNGIPIYKSQDDVLYIDGNLAVRGGITQYATDAIDVESIIDSLPIASTSAKGIASFNSSDFSVVDGYVSLVGSTGGIDLSNYLPLSGGQMTGNIGYTLDADNHEVGIPSAGALNYDNGLETDGVLNSKKSFIGSVFNRTTGIWYNMISVRHRNGHADGNKYGMYISCALTSHDSLAWNRHLNGTWDGERVILDNQNWSNYISLQGEGNFISTSGGEISNSSTGLFINRTTASTNPHITFKSQGTAIGDIGVSASNMMPAFYSYNKGAWEKIWCESNFNPNDYMIVTRPTCKENLLIDGINSRGSYPSLTFHIANTNWAQFIMDGDGVVELRDGSSQSGSFKRLKVADLSTYSSPGIHVHRDSGVPYIRFYSSNVTVGELGFRSNGVLSNWDFNSSAWCTVAVFDVSGNLLSPGGMTMYSDIRKKTKLKDVELSLKQIADAPLIEHYYNSDEKKTTHVGSIAQYWASMNDWFCKLDNEGYYTMEIQNAALASAISIARHLQRYENKTDRKIRMLKERVKELENKLEKYELNKRE